MQVVPLTLKKILQFFIKNSCGGGWIFYPVTLKETEIEKPAYFVFVFGAYLKTRV